MAHWNKGKKRSEEQKQRQREYVKKWCKDNPERVIEMGRKRSISLKKFYQDMRDNGTYEEYIKETGRKSSLTQIGKYTGKNSPSYGRHHTKEERKKMSLAKKGFIPWNKGLTKETDIRIANSMAPRPHSEEWNRNKQIRLKKSKKWQKYMKSKERRENCIKGGVAMRSGTDIRPTTPEVKFINLCEKYSLPYKYVGDGQLWMGYPPKNPDFININGEKKVVEINGVYWHLLKPQKQNPSLTKKDVEIKEMAHYEPYGFKSIIIWEDEMDNDEIILKKLGITYK